MLITVDIKYIIFKEKLMNVKDNFFMSLNFLVKFVGCDGLYQSLVGYICMNVVA